MMQETLNIDRFDFSFVIGQISALTSVSPYLLLENDDFKALLKKHIKSESPLDMAINDCAEFVNANY